MSGGKPRALILGLPYFGGWLARALSGAGWDARFLPHPGRSPAGWARVARGLARADVLYLVAARAEAGSPLDRLLVAWRRPAVIHWVGTDVLIARDEWLAGRLSSRIASRAIHWADAPWLVDELAEMGIAAQFVPLPVESVAHKPPPLPPRFTVLLYLPVDDFDREVFDMETILALPRDLPDVDFILLPSTPATLPDALPANVETPGWVESLEWIYERTTVLARLVTHDGMSFMVLEAMSRGRPAIYRYALPGVTVAEGREAVTAAIRAFKAEHDAGTLRLNESGMAWVRAEYAESALTASLDRRLRALVGRS